MSARRDQKARTEQETVWRRGDEREREREREKSHVATKTFILFPSLFGINKIKRDRERERERGGAEQRDGW
jgi:hypothetical protein